jgi:hypothetical protein
MTFFYDLNKRLANLASKQDAKQITEDAKATAPKSQLAESLDMAEAGYSAKAGRAGKDLGKPGKNFGKIAKSAGERYGSKAAGERVAGAVLNKLRHPKESEMDESAFQAAIGKKKYGDEGMKALQKAGREHASDKTMSNIRNRYDKYDESQGMTDEGNAFTGALASTPKGGKFKVGNKEFTDTSSLEEVDMTPKQKSFAKLAPPTDKITFADKIAGAKQEVDEMLGDVAADAMKSAVKKMGEADVTGLGEEEMDEGYAEMDAWLKSREKEKGTGRFDKKKISTGTVYTRKPETFDDPETEPEATGGAPKRKGRPAGTRRAIGAKHSGRSKLASKDAIAEEGSTPQEQAYIEIVKLLKDPESRIDSSIRNRLMRLVRTLNVSEPVAEKAVSVAQRRAAGIAHAAQKGEIPKSELRGASKEMAKMPKGELHKFAATKEKRLPNKVKEEGKPDYIDLDKDGNKKEPMKQAAKQAKGKKEEKVDETTTSGSVATAPAAPKASKGMQFGKGVYEGLSSKLETMITEGMSITANMSAGDEGEPRKSITVTADGAEADKLAELLKMAGLEQKQEVCPGCGSTDCGCGDEMVDENSPDWPTNTEKLDAQPQLRTYSGGLNGPKSTGQTTVPVVASQLRRTSTMEENVELERTLFKTWKNYKG